MIFEKVATPSYLQVIFRGHTGLIPITEGGGPPNGNDGLQES